MQIASLNWTEVEGWQADLPAAAAQDLVLYFGGREALSDTQRHLELRRMFPEACLLGCSTGGQIGHETGGETDIRAIALRFDTTTIRSATETIKCSDDSYSSGKAIGRALASDDLAGVFVLSDGLMVNGSELIDGIGSEVGGRRICGGLAGDGAHFAETLVGLNGPPRSGAVAAIGFYGSAIKIGYGSAGGWSVFGPKRRITHAEDSGLIGRIGEWFLRESCRQAASWPKPLNIAVNLSPVQFRSGDLPARVLDVLLETGLAPHRLELEITEGVLIDDFERGIEVLRRLKAMGVSIAMDDFGTGYSSLKYLQAFPFDKIKIDQAFVSQLDTNAQSRAIIRAVIGLAHGLALPVLAEGVETSEQLDFLRSEGCDEVQGYLLGRPAPIEHYSDLTGQDVVPHVVVEARRP